MRARQVSAMTARAAALGALLAIGGCSHLRWPWHHAPPPAPVPVHEVDVTGSMGPAQYWKRNTLLIDLSSASGTGSLVLTPTAGGGWPVRLAFRVRPGAFGALEVRGAERQVLPISATGTAPVDLELPPGIYTASTPRIAVSWGPAAKPEPAP